MLSPSRVPSSVKHSEDLLGHVAGCACHWKRWFSLSEDPLGVSGPEWAGGAHLLHPAREVPCLRSRNGPVVPEPYGCLTISRFFTWHVERFTFFSKQFYEF